MNYKMFYSFLKKAYPGPAILRKSNRSQVQPALAYASESATYEIILRPVSGSQI